MAIVTNVGRDAVDAEASLDERRLRPAKPFGEDGWFADGEVVWSWRPDAGVNAVMMLSHHAGDGDTKPDHQGEHEGPR